MSLARTTDPFVALGYLSGSDNRPRRDQIRLVSRPFADGGVVYRFVMAMAESAGEHSAATLKEARAAGDIVMLNVSDTPFRCALKYVLWTAWAREAFPSARYLASGDDDAYVQLAHLEADLRLAHAQVGEVAAYYGCIMWRPYYNNVTQDASTGFTGWTCADGQAAGVRRGMEACAKQAAAKPAVRALRKKAELAPDAPACAGLAANEKRLNAILAQQVDWDLPPFPMANGPLFAVSRPLAGHSRASEYCRPLAPHMHMALPSGQGRASSRTLEREAPFPSCRRAAPAVAGAASTHTSLTRGLITIPAYRRPPRARLALASSCRPSQWCAPSPSQASSRATSRSTTASPSRLARAACAASSTRTSRRRRGGGWRRWRGAPSSGAGTAPTATARRARTRSCIGRWSCSAARAGRMATTCWRCTWRGRARATESG